MEAAAFDRHSDVGTGGIGGALATTRFILTRKYAPVFIRTAL